MALLFVVAVVLALLFVPGSASGKVRGASPSFDGATLKCVPITARRGGPKLIISTRINDDYCDCADGADEPGTSACSNGRFYCVNKPHRPQFIPSSLVDDGVCDCCDGSDEPAGRCTNTCTNISIEARLEASKKAASITKGVKQRKEMSAAAKKNESKERSELREKKRELEKVKSELDTCRKHEDGLRAYQKTTTKEEKNDDADNDHVPLGDDDYEGDTYNDEDDGMGEDETVNKADGGEENEGQDYGYEGADEANDADVKSPETEHKSAREQDTSPPKTNDASTAEQDSSLPEGQATENASETAQMDLEPFCQELVVGKGNKVMQNARLLLFKVAARVRKLAPRLFGMQAPKQLDKCIERAEERRGELEGRQSSLEQAIEELEKKLNRNYGSDGALRGLVGQCFKKKLTQYEWEHCPFDVVKQYEHGRYIASLGDFQKIEENTMSYEGGAHCWNGPLRSVKVTLVCGESNEVIAVDEPNRCTYTMVFATPAVCEEEHAKAILNDVTVDDEMKTEL